MATMYHKRSGSIDARGIMPFPALEVGKPQKIVSACQKYGRGRG
jgi:hypothetical protein